MLITKYTHACVRLEDHGQVLVLDPGTWTEGEALTGATAVLVTHEHEDHVDVPRLAGLGLPVYAPAGADLPGLDFIPLSSGESLTIGGFLVQAVGGEHAVTYDGLPGCPNLGYVVDEAVYHPGDSVHLSGQPIETLLVPAHGPWLKLDEAIGFLREIRPQRSFPIHDGGLSERGLDNVNGWLGEYGGPGYRYLAPGESL